MRRIAKAMAVLLGIFVFSALIGVSVFGGWYCARIQIVDFNGVRLGQRIEKTPEMELLGDSETLGAAYRRSGDVAMLLRESGADVRGVRYDYRDGRFCSGIVLLDGRENAFAFYDYLARRYGAPDVEIEKAGVAMQGWAEWPLFIAFFYRPQEETGSLTFHHYREVGTLREMTEMLRAHRPHLCAPPTRHRARSVRPG